MSKIVFALLYLWVGVWTAAIGANLPADGVTRAVRVVLSVAAWPVALPLIAIHIGSIS